MGNLFSSPKPTPLPDAPDTDAAEAQAKSNTRRNLKLRRTQTVFTDSQGVTDTQKKTTLGGV
jgi:hypothetical protein